MGAGISWRQARKQQASASSVLTASKPQAKFSKSALTRHFEALTSELESAMAAVTPGKDDRQLLQTHLGRLRNTALRLDWQRLSADDAKNLTDAIYVRLPRTIEACCDDAYEQGGWEDVWEMRDYEFSSIQSAVGIVVRTQMNPDYLSTQGATLQQEVVEEEAPAEVTFPKLKSLSEEIDLAVAELELLWKATASLQVAIEDRYLLDQVAGRYLIDTWQMLESYASMPVELREVAGNMVREQLQILTHQISEIQHRSAGHSLDSLRTQTEFIRAQHQQRSGSKLSLDSTLG